MGANTAPIFTKTPVIGMATIGTANTARDGTGTLGTIVTGGTEGTRISKITIQAIVTTTAGMVRLFIGDDAVSPTIKLWREIPITAITVSATVTGFYSVLLLGGEAALVLPPDYTLQASTHNAESFNIIAEGGQLEE